ncbi:E1 dehydrogenase [Chloropicon primus]|uniref:E1 dehydrogenase n=1 Tax=Chloropicon primus TaxID=1764295 RepID=A0A5B8MJT2_9CHLO|nr:E1 dehydrogenase [Chloropicon primus]UPQ99935.1 E1 dehydrogenase [Chloropicon primus]|eukprot:QDZ20723.1 E1 dehydrogenase [Chloropicon primus]
MAAKLLLGKSAMVTGAGRGIGLACARALGLSGAKVYLAEIDEELGQAAEKKLAGEGIEAKFTKCDVGSKASVDNAVETVVQDFGGLDICVANAAILRVGNFLDLSEEDFDSVIRVNLKGVFLTGQAAARQMVEQNKAKPGRGGSIINMSSVNAIMAIPSITAYNTAKGGVNNLTRNMAVSLAAENIRVNAIGPGSIKTELLDSLDKDSLSRILSRTPLGRLGQPKEIGDIAVFLASELSSYMSGQTLYADGGRMALNYTCPVPDDD